MKFQTALGVCVITISGSASAAIDLQGNQTLILDTVLDGQLVSNLQNIEYDFAGGNKHFIAQTPSEVLSGNANADDQLIHFKISNPSLGRIKYFTGRHDGTSFVGTWYSNLGEQGDWKFSPQYQDSLNSCQSILQAGFSTGDGQYTIQTDSNESVTVYCDMTTDGGGWTLVGSFPKNHAGGIKSLTDYGSIPATSDFNPSVLWMYQGGLSHFSDAREQVACSQSQCTDGKSVYGVNMSTVELENIRLSWAHEDKMIAMPQRTDIPTCRTSLNDATTTFEGCTNPAYVNMVNTPTLLGWQNDVNGRYCWAARGTYKPNSVGSSLCNSSEPNGTKWALLWMR